MARIAGNSEVCHVDNTSMSTYVLERWKGEHGHLGCRVSRVAPGALPPLPSPSGAAAGSAAAALSSAVSLRYVRTPRLMSLVARKMSSAASSTVVTHPGSSCTHVNGPGVGLCMANRMPVCGERRSAGLCRLLVSTHLVKVAASQGTQDRGRLHDLPVAIPESVRQTVLLNPPQGGIIHAAALPRRQHPTESGGCGITKVVSIDTHQNQIPACSSMQSCKMISMHCRAMPAVHASCATEWKVHHAVPDQGQHTHQSTSGLSPEGCRRRTLNMKFAMAPVERQFECSSCVSCCSSRR